MKIKESYQRLEEDLWDILHNDVTSESLLNLFNIRFHDQLKQKHKKSAQIIDKGSKLISNLFFVTGHIDRIIEKNHPKVLRNNKSPYYSIYDQVDEITLELIHSLLCVRLGMSSQAINSLRRCLESMVYGSLVSISFYKFGKGRMINPFLDFEIKDTWHEMGSGINNDRITKKAKQLDKTNDEILSNFTFYYLTEFSHPYCEIHRKKKLKEKTRIAVKIPNHKLKCRECKNTTSFVIPNTLPNFHVMTQIIRITLQNNTKMDTSKLYGDLSSYVHASPVSHQHSPSFYVKEIKSWYYYLEKILNALIMIYVKTIEFHGYDTENSLKFLYDLNFKLNKFNKGKARKILCSKLEP